MNKSHMMLPAIATLLAAAAPGAASAEPLRDTLISDARELSPAGLVFERTTTATKHSPLSKETSVTIERWNGKVWTLVSVDGGTPNSSHQKAFRKITLANPVPGYYRLAPLLAAAAGAGADAAGHQVLKIAVLPAGSVSTDNGDISSHLWGEAMVTTTNGKPWVTQLKLHKREDFKLTSMIKVTDFEQVFDYRLGPDGRPRLATQTAQSTGKMMGFSGGEVNEVKYNYR